MKLWGGRFTAETDKAVEAFTASIHFDRRMYAEDICGSIVHAEMLAKENIITQTDKKDIIEGLKKIYRLIEKDEFEFSDAAEDIHMSIEQKLTDMIGEGGKRLHTGCAYRTLCWKRRSGMKMLLCPAIPICRERSPFCSVTI